MVVFTVFEPPSPTGDRIARAERLALVKDGFHWWAALAPPFWLLAKGLWVEFGAFIAAAGALAWALEAVGANADMISLAFLIVQVVFGFEASTIHSLALRWRGWRELGTVTGRDQLECERRFFEQWAASAPQVDPNPQADPPRGPWTAGLEGAKGVLTRGSRIVGAKA